MGKKSRKSKAAVSATAQAGPGTTYDSQAFLKGAIDLVSRIIKTVEDDKLPIESGFSKNVHRISSCDGDGAYNIVSMFTVNGGLLENTGGRELSFFTCVTIRCHDNVRQTLFIPCDLFSSDDMRRHFFRGNDPGSNLSNEQYYDRFLEDTEKETENSLRSASYHQCAKLIAGALERMRTMKKVLVGKEERTVVRLFGQKIVNEEGRSGINFPTPSPAPSVEELWVTMNRPEYYAFTANEKLHDFYRCEPKKKAITEEIFDESARHLLEDEYSRTCFIAMLEHMAYWHMLNSEDEVVSWLLWERQSIKADQAGSGPVFAIKKNVIFQLMVNKFFDCKVTHMWLPAGLNERIQNYMIYSANMAVTKKLPPGLLVTANIAPVVNGSDAENLTSDGRVGDICKSIRKLKVRKSSCAICGATRSSTNGGKLSVCSKVNFGGKKVEKKVFLSALTNPRLRPVRFCGILVSRDSVSLSKNDGTL